MQDVYHVWGGDLATGPSGDLVIAFGSDLGQQRVLRRLLTNPGDYIWQPDYGAGLGAYVGVSVHADEIAATIRSQMFQEASVARSPEPVITIQASDGGAVYVHIQYLDLTTSINQVLAFTVGT